MNLRTKVERKKPSFPSVILQILETRGAFIFSALLFRVILEVGYWIYVSTRHAYAGYIWAPNLIKFVESWVLFFLLLAFAPKFLKRVSDGFIVILLFGLLTPLLSFYGVANQPRFPLYTVLMGYALIAIFRKGQLFRFHFLKEGPVIARSTVILGAAAIGAWFFLSGAYSYFQLDLTEVYEYRRLAGQEINVGILAYINTWAYKVFGPTLLALGLWRKSFKITVAALLLHVFWFGVSAHKAVLFYPLLVLFLWFFFRRTRGLSIFPLSFAVVVLASTFIFIIFQYGLAPSLFVRRVFYTPAKLTFDYYEFFGSHEFVWWSNSITTFFKEYPYEIGPARLIGEWNGSGASANNTFLSTGFMHAGVFGVGLYSTITGLLFRLIDSLGNKGIPTWLALSVLIVPARSLLLSADLPTSLLTHGIGVGIIILFLLRSLRPYFLK